MVFYYFSRLVTENSNFCLWYISRQFHSIRKVHYKKY